MTDQEEHAFIRRVLAYQDGALSKDELEAFSKELIDEPEKRRRFIELQDRSALIAKAFRRRAVSGMEDEDLQEKAKIQRPNAWSVWRKVGLGLVAACLLVVASVSLRDSVDERHVAKIDFRSLDRWSHETEVSDWLVGGERYELQSGNVRLAMNGGAIVTVASPSAFTLVDGKVINLDYGKLSARMPSKAAELTVNAGNMKVTDLGTAFGMTIEPEQAPRVAVFEGEVEVKSNSILDDDTPLRLTEGQAVLGSIAGAGVFDVTEFNPREFQDIWPLTAGIDEASSYIEFVPPGPIDSLADYSSDTKLFLLAEQLDVNVQKSFRADLTEPGVVWPPDDKDDREGNWVSPGQVLSSYLFFFKPEHKVAEIPHKLSGRVSFDGRIVGVVTLKRQLVVTDEMFGLESLDYKSMSGRRLEPEKSGRYQIQNDSMMISENGRDLIFDLHAGLAQDHFRVLVAPD